MKYDLIQGYTAYLFNCLFSRVSKAMRIAGSFTPNSAAAERVFSALKRMFGDQQMVALADYIQAAMMLWYNDRKVG